jgi:hypothetical protein
MEVSGQLQAPVPGYSLDRRLSGPLSRSGFCGIEKNLFLPPEIAPLPSNSPSLYRGVLIFSNVWLFANASQNFQMFNFMTILKQISYPVNSMYKFSTEYNIKVVCDK